MARYIDADMLWEGRPQPPKNKYKDERYIAGFNECMHGFSERIRKQIDHSTGTVPESELIIDEFVRRLKEKLYTVPTVYNAHFRKMVDDVVTEMKGGAE